MAGAAGSAGSAAAAAALPLPLPLPLLLLLPPPPVLPTSGAARRRSTTMASRSSPSRHLASTAVPALRFPGPALAWSSSDLVTFLLGWLLIF